MTKRHSMTATITPDATEWRCATCGRHVRLDASGLTILVRGDTSARHRGQTGVRGLDAHAGQDHFATQEGHD